MEKKEFYKTEEKKSLTYLEFGSIDLLKGKKEVYDFRIDDIAYDWFMVGRYANDLYVYNYLKENIENISNEVFFEFYSEKVQHQEDSYRDLHKLLALYFLN